MTIRDRIRWLLLAVSGLAVIPFAQWVSITPVGTDLLWLFVGTLYGLVAVGALLSIPIFLARLAGFENKWNSAFYLALAILALAATIGGVFLGRSIRMNAMHALAQRSKPLIAAIRQYEIDNATPPPSLTSLVPKYLPAVPSTQMMANPEYHYQTGGTTAADYGGNQWVLVVPTSNGFMNWDQMLYFPNQTYPKHGYGGSLEPVGNWAYVHE